MEFESKAKVARGVAWQSGAQWGANLLNFGIYTGLARLLSPRIFGLLAIASVYVAFIQVFVRQGFGAAIVQRQALEREHLDSAFWIATGTASVLCFLSFFLATPIAQIFSEPTVAPVIKWLSITFLFGALGSIPTAILTRELNFRPLAVSSFVAAAAGGAVGLTMAYLGWGVWSLVGQQLVNSALVCVYLGMAVRWRPGFQISKRHLRDLYGFSLTLIGNDLLWFFTEKSDQTLVGYGFGSAVLGPYSLASRLITLLRNGILTPLKGVAFPLFSRLQGEPEKLEVALRKFCELSSFVSLPVFAGTAVLAPELVPLLFGPKWTSAVLLLQILASYGASRVLVSFTAPILLAKGRTGTYLVIDIVQATLILAGCLIALRWGPAGIGLSMIVTTLVFAAFLVVLVSLKVMEIRPMSLLKSFEFPVMSTLFMAVAVSFLRDLVIKTFGPVPTVAFCVLAGATVYSLTALLARPDLVRTVWQMAASIFVRAVPRECRSASELGVEYAVDGTSRSLKP